ncbi:hypothetical protein GCM10027404_08030 [Arthrobacter tumbae]|uniref:hypothetical protein n=1 Tax=Arthrobacter tumbae TaxID=163874 RepID=UPI00195E0B93|nr:hypothetical protein [Arthrobacter tumbae]MBM7782088.1 hypothetical protein [Arthrobacter tumbae]
MRHNWLVPAVLSVLLLSACGASSPAATYEQAISAVDGVESVTVQWERAGAGDLTFVDVSTATNDPTELHRILDGSMRAFIGSADPHEETTLSYLVYSQDRSTYLTPSDLGPVMRSLSDIREHYGID